MATRIRQKPAPAATRSAAHEMAGRADAAADLLKALANPQRLRILCLLHDSEMSVGELNQHVDLSQSALSQHLAVLREKTLVQTRRDAQTVYYTLAPGPVSAIIHTLHGIYCADC
ncbi:MAG: transcriptional regulator [Lysobacterales bacterium CG17_big_fil_post_rev_8_21_14_2_50_64_11]|nr:MAG: transcriptional regulator [Xanthomonadales bacterium CG17_big_fil_post_rev_8_21_14_2_50_64_11]PIX59754.1 MAG: transcriptional regulator [Xanthomonadales bacterium CG_4_10_14_3_um_filter_64_11]